MSSTRIAVVLFILASACHSASKPNREEQLERLSADASVSSSDEGAVEPPFKPLPIENMMMRVRGQYCPEVEQRCLRWLDKDQSPTANFGIGPLRCAEFAPPRCLSKARRSMDFYIDKYEWPDKENEFPLVTIDWYSAKAKCEARRARLCTADEWTFACEGEGMKPYPYGDGLHRDDTACNIDQPSMDPSTPRSEWPKHNRSVPSGVMTKCVSPFGVHDMTGNVDEWVHNVGGRTDGDPYFSGLKGGYWSKVRNRCRPMTTVHGPGHSFYQQGFRCCKDVE